MSGETRTYRGWLRERDHGEAMDVLLEHVKRISGVGEARYHSHYSEVTGYLWTDEDLNVGGHDLLAELKSHVGKFCHLEITYSQDPITDGADEPPARERTE